MISFNGIEETKTFQLLQIVRVLEMKELGLNSRFTPMARKRAAEWLGIPKPLSNKKMIPMLKKLLFERADEQNIAQKLADSLRIGG